MDSVNGLLSTEIITGVIIIGCFAMGVRSILAFTNEVAELRPKLNELERRLGNLRDSMQSYQDKVDKLSDDVRPLKQQEAHMRSYYDEMKRIELDSEREKLVTEEKEENKRELNIQRKKMGDI